MIYIRIGLCVTNVLSNVSYAIDSWLSKKLEKFRVRNNKRPALIQGSTEYR